MGERIGDETVVGIKIKIWSSSKVIHNLSDSKIRAFSMQDKHFYGLSNH